MGNGRGETMAGHAGGDDACLPPFPLYSIEAENALTDATNISGVASTRHTQKYDVSV